MDTQLLLVIAPLLGLGANALCQLLLLHASRGKAIGFSIIVGAIAGMAATLYITCKALAGNEEAAAYLMLNALCAAALAFCYWTFLNLNITSLRIRVLKELLRAPPYTVTRDQLLKEYSQKEMLDRRLRRLINAGQLGQFGGRYYVRRPFLFLLASGITLMRKLLLPARKTLFML